MTGLSARSTINKPFDESVVEQLAGDLLPNPRLDQLVATGHNRCNVTTNERAGPSRKKSMCAMSWIGS